MNEKKCKTKNCESEAPEYMPHCVPCANRSADRALIWQFVVLGIVLFAWAWSWVTHR